MVKQWIYISFLIFCSFGLHAQEYFFKPRQIIFFAKDTLYITDSLLIDPFTIQIHKLNSDKNKINFKVIDQGKIILIENSTLDSLVLTYQTIPLKSSFSYSIYDSSLINSPVIPENALQYFEINKKSDNWWSGSGVDYSGSFSRGLSIGNSQSLVLNSSLNLQLSGDLGDGLSITGAISDNQIPIQPDGNTKQIQEFDKLFIKISKKRNHLTVGDFEISKPTGYFVNYYKRNKGGMLDLDQKFKFGSLQQKAAVAISKGKSNRYALKTQNGNQGPYRIIGREGESFIIILAGSEKVYYDGEILERGEDADYTMDYNQSEIRFTPKRIISDYSRIIIEFEYSDQNYIRSLLNYNAVLNTNNSSFYLNFIQERDSKKSSFATDQDSSDRRILAASGDDINLATRSGLRKAGIDFSPNRIYYRQRDSFYVLNGQTIPQTILIYDPFADSSAYQVGFSEVTQGQGSYRLKLSNVNGRVYEWISPDEKTGEKKGSYEPVVPLIAPQSQSMFNLGYNWKNSKNANINFECSGSHLDKNRLSNIQDNDNLGLAAKLSAGSSNISMPIKNLTGQFHGAYEWNDSRFRALNPYRNQEFNRDWNISNQTFAAEQLYSATANFKYGKQFSQSNELSGLYRSTDFSGIRIKSGILWKDSLTEIKGIWNFQQNQDLLESSNFIRPSLQIERKVYKTWGLFSSAQREKNTRRSINSDSLNKSSFYFDQWEAGIKKELNRILDLRIAYKERIEYAPSTFDFEKKFNSKELNIQSSLNHSKFGNAEIQFLTRNIQFEDLALNDSLGQNYFLGLLDHNISLLKQSCRIKNNYQILSGTEPRQEFIFEEKKPGEGSYLFVDYNKDGIRQSQEYIYAPDVDSARFIKIQLFNSEYYQIYQSSWNHFFSFTPEQLIPSNHKKWKWFRKCSFESILRVSSKVNNEATNAEKINPFVYLQSNNHLLSYQAFLQQQFFYNRAHPKYELQLGSHQGGSRLLYVSGTEERNNKEYFFKSRITIYQKWDLILGLNQKYEEHLTEQYTLQNYNLVYSIIEPEISYRYSPNFRIKCGGLWKKINETEFSKEAGLIKSILLDGNYSLNRKFNFRTNVKYLRIQYNGSAGSPIEFIMLEGFKSGDNFSFDNQFEYRLNSLITISLAYTGRKSNGSGLLNSGRAIMRAQF